VTTPQLVRARRTDAIRDRHADDGAVYLGPRPAGKRQPHGTILLSSGRRFTVEVTATIQQARAWRMITKAVIPREATRQ